MPIRLEYIVSNSKGNELKRFDVKTEAEAYDSVICAAEDISLLIQPLQKKLALTEEQIDTIAEHLAFQSEEVKLALKQIKKSKTTVQPGKISTETKSPEETEPSKPKTAVRKAAVVKSGKKK